MSVLRQPLFHRTILKQYTHQYPLCKKILLKFNCWLFIFKFVSYLFFFFYYNFHDAWFLLYLRGLNPLIRTCLTWSKLVSRNYFTLNCVPLQLFSRFKQRSSSNSVCYWSTVIGKFQTNSLTTKVLLKSVGLRWKILVSPPPSTVLIKPPPVPDGT